MPSSYQKPYHKGLLTDTCSQQKLFFWKGKKNVSSPKKGKHKIMTRRVFFLQINLDAPKQKHLQSIREMRILSRIFLNTSLLCFTNPYVFPKVVKYHFQLKFTGLCRKLLVLFNYSAHG